MGTRTRSRTEGDAMSFIDTNGIEVGTLLGAEHGATRVFLFRTRRVPPGPSAGPHRHGGDEAIRVVRRRLRVRVGGETRAISPGEIAVVPPPGSRGLRIRRAKQSAALRSRGDAGPIGESPHRVGFRASVGG